MSVKNKIYKSLTEKLHLKIISNEEEISELKKSPPTDKIISYKILIIGTDSVGKTSFCNRISRDAFDLEIKSSIETTCFLKTLTLFEEEIKLFLIDLKTNSLDEDDEKELYKDIDGIITLYDITQYDSYEKSEKILNNIKKKIKWDNSIPVYMLGNKKDLSFLRAIDYDESKQKANIKGYEFKEINCNKDEDIAFNIIKNLVARIYFNRLNNEEKEKIKNEAKNYDNK